MPPTSAPSPPSLSGIVDPDLDFVVHIGGDDFIILFRSEDWEERCHLALTEFARVAKTFFDGKHIERGGVPLGRPSGKEGVPSPDLTLHRPRGQKNGQEDARKLPLHQSPPASLLAIVALGRHHGLQIVAEGVENEAQFTLLTKAGCDELQGFFIHKPLDPEVAPEAFAESTNRLLARTEVPTGETPATS
ncbi:MAG: EAL domain-containing protein, partial [Magnetococcales bacterium]|nr:EAL domain-containing protein [Magnetococcales bacterium]